MLSPQEKEHLALERECYLQIFHDVRQCGPAKFIATDFCICPLYSLPLLLHLLYDLRGIFQCFSEGYFSTSQIMSFWFISLKQMWYGVRNRLAKRSWENSLCKDETVAQLNQDTKVLLI